MSHIQPQYQVLDDLLQRRLFRIPDYQRAYSWERRQRNDLFEDLSKLLDKDDERHHFMATIVCLKAPEKAAVGTKEFQYLDVVDGQQRLTTLIILLKAISKTLANGEASDIEESSELDKLLVKGDERLILLQTNHDSSMIFANYLRNGAAPSAKDIHTHADQLLAEAISDSELFAKRSDSVQLLKAIKNRLGFIFYELHDESTVYTVFEVLNSRGLPVDSLDKCKSMLMGLAYEHLRDKRDAAEDLIDELHGHWKEIYKVIGLTAVPGSEILRFGAALLQPAERARLLSDDDSLDFFRERGGLQARKVVESAKWLLDVTKTEVPLYRNARWSAVTEITQARLLAVALLMTDTLTAEQRGKALRQWENTTFRIYALFDLDSRTKVGDYNRLAQRIIGKDQAANTYPKIMRALRELGEKYAVGDAVAAFKGRGDAYDGWEESLRYFLFRYEQDRATSDGASVSAELWDQIWSASASKSIEHIAPQEFSTNWGDSWTPYYQTYLPLVHRLGNLLIVPPGINSEAGQKSFADKKGIYRKNFLRMMNDVLDYESWGPEQIQEREKILLDWALVAFDDVTE